MRTAEPPLSHTNFRECLDSAVHLRFAFSTLLGPLSWFPASLAGAKRVTSLSTVFREISGMRRGIRAYTSPCLRDLSARVLCFCFGAMQVYKQTNMPNTKLDCPALYQCALNTPFLHPLQLSAQVAEAASDLN